MGRHKHHQVVVDGLSIREMDQFLAGVDALDGVLQMNCDAFRLEHVNEFEAGVGSGTVHRLHVRGVHGDLGLIASPCIDYDRRSIIKQTVDYISSRS